MGKLFGYARVSSTDQNLTIQLESLNKVKCDVIREEKQTGTSMVDRKELKTLLAFIGEDDVLVVTRLDRLGRSVLDLHQIVEQLKSKKAHLRVLEQSVDTTTPEGRAFFGMLSVFAEFETDIRRSRQLEGIAKAKEEGKYSGRKSEISSEQVKELKNSGMGATAISKELGISRASVYRLLKSV